MFWKKSVPPLHIPLFQECIINIVIMILCRVNIPSNLSISVRSSPCLLMHLFWLALTIFCLAWHLFICWLFILVQCLGCLEFVSIYHCIIALVIGVNCCHYCNDMALGHSDCNWSIIFLTQWSTAPACLIFICVDLMQFLRTLGHLLSILIICGLNLIVMNIS